MAATICRECGKPVLRASTRGPRKLFCSAACGKVFNNRRMVRGAELYDLFRQKRRNRSEADALKVDTAMSRLDTLWEDEDRAAGRVTISYRPLREALDDLDRRDRVPTTNVGFVRPA